LKKPVQLTKFIVCGLLASTLLACQKSSDRPLRATMNKVNDKATQQSLVPCNEKATNQIKSRQDLLIKMKTLIAEAEVRELTDEKKSELQKMVIDLASISKSLIEEIKSIKSGKPQTSAGCQTVDATNPDKKTSHTIAQINETDLEIAKKVAEITKKTNSIVQEDQNAQQLKSETTLIEEQTYALTPEFVSAMSESKKDGHMYISEGKVHDQASAKEDMKKLLAEKKSSLCYLEITSGEIKDTDKITIKIIRVKADEAAKNATLKIVFAGEEDKLSSLACFINTDKEIMTEARKVFGSLIKLQ
jgi:hypothetical protein